MRTDADAKAERILPALFIKMFGDPATNPMGWEEVSLGKLIVDGPQNGLYKHASTYGDGTPILRINSFYDGAIDESIELRRLKLADHEIKLYQLRENDIVINRVNGSLEYVGKSALIPRLSEPTVFESNMMRFSVDTTKIDPIYLICHLQTPAVRQQIISKAKHINQASINQGDVKSLKILLPPKHYQLNFADNVKRMQKIITSQQISRSKLENTFHSILQRAFSGELTAKWREAHMKELLAEMEEQAKALNLKDNKDSQQLSLL